MRYLLIILIGILPLAANAQIDTLPWCPPGATWVYSSSLYISKEIKYVKDTFLLGKEAKQLAYSMLSYPDYVDFDFEYYIYMTIDSGKLYLYRDERVLESFYVGNIQREERWHLLCDFNAQVGDSWQFKEESNLCDSIDTITITEIDTTRILAAPFLTEEYILESQNSTKTSSFFKGIGATKWYPFGVNYLGDSSSGFCEGAHEFSGQITPLGCYSDDLRGTIVARNYDSFNFSEKCKMITTIDEVYYKDVVLYPNPTSNFISLKNMPKGIYTLSVFDHFGKKVMQDVEWDNKPIVIDNLSNGVYYLNVKAASGEAQFFKFLKE